MNGLSLASSFYNRDPTVEMIVNLLFRATLEVAKFVVMTGNYRGIYLIRLW